LGFLFGLSLSLPFCALSVFSYSTLVSGVCAASVPPFPLSAPFLFFSRVPAAALSPAVSSICSFIGFIPIFLAFDLFAASRRSSYGRLDIEIFLSFSPLASAYHLLPHISHHTSPHISQVCTR
jgi:hypothetical protein